MAVVRRSHRSSQELVLDRMLEQLETRGIGDRCVLAALTVVPRDLFLAQAAVPYELARRVQALELVGDEHVLAVGLGSGYETAVLSLLSAHVYGIDPDPAVSSSAHHRLTAIGSDGYSIACRNTTEGWPEHGPYDAILVATPIDAIPETLVEQLSSGGRIVAVIRDRLVRATKHGDHDIVVTDLGPAPREEGN